MACPLAVCSTRPTHVATGDAFVSAPAKCCRGLPKAACSCITQTWYGNVLPKEAGMAALPLKCSSLCPRPLCPMDLRRINKATAGEPVRPLADMESTCAQPEDVPCALTDFETEGSWKLCVLWEMDHRQLEVAGPHSAIVFDHWGHDCLKPGRIQDLLTTARGTALPKHKDRKAGRAALDSKPSVWMKLRDSFRTRT